MGEQLALLYQQVQGARRDHNEAVSAGDEDGAGFARSLLDSLTDTAQSILTPRKRSLYN